MTIEPQSKPEAAGHLRLRLWVRLLRAARPIEAELRRRLGREFGVTLPKFDVMAALARREAGMTMTEVSRLLMVSNGNVTGLVDRLVAEGLVMRVANEKDRRATFQTMVEAHERWVNDILGCFSDEQSEAMVGLLDALRAETRTGGRSS
jgi:DNA-binding MarR family transcriptional regulator